MIILKKGEIFENSRFWHSFFVSGRFVTSHFSSSRIMPSAIRQVAFRLCKETPFLTHFERAHWSFFFLLLGKWFFVRFFLRKIVDFLGWVVCSKSYLRPLLCLPPGTIHPVTGPRFSGPLSSDFFTNRFLNHFLPTFHSDGALDTPCLKSWITVNFATRLAS